MHKVDNTSQFYAPTREMSCEQSGAVGFTLKALWDRLRMNLPEGPIDLRAKMIAVETGGQFSASELFTRLHQKLKEEGIVTTQMAVSLQEFQVLQRQQSLKEALCALGKAVQEQLKLPAPFQSAEGVRNFLEAPGSRALLEQIQHIELKDAKIRVLPPEIQYLTGLKTLDLTTNALTDLPSEMRYLTALTSLCLSKNAFTHLPPVLWSLPQLQQLIIEDNRLTSIPPEIYFLSQLTQLDCTSNKITTVAKEIGTLTQLRTLNLEDNELKSVPQEIANCLWLEELDILGNPYASMFIPHAILESTRPVFASNPVISQHFNAGLNFTSSAPMVLLYQTILRGGSTLELVQAFYQVSREDQECIQGMITEISEERFDDMDDEEGPSPSGLWGRDHTFCNMEIFKQAVERAVHTQFNNLLPEQKKSVLAICGKERTVSNLADALDRFFNMQ